MNTDTKLKVWAGLAAAALMAPQAASAYDAAAATAAANGSACDAASPFYWEIGASSGSPIVSGQVGGTTYSRTSVMPLASASKWVFGAYVVERFGGIPTGSAGAQIVKALNMQAGYTSLNDLLCKFTTTVSSCFTLAWNDNYDPDADGEYFYDSGHGQQIAASSSHLNLGSKTRTTLMTEINSQLSLPSSFSYNNVTPSSGMSGSAEGYAVFLQRLMDGTYEMSNHLDYDPVDTYPCDPLLSGCSPSGSVDFHYSLHHWIEDNTGGTLPNGVTLGAGDGAYSSAGAYGFYPWISADLEYYGIVARDDGAGAGQDSLVCGRAIREAFFN